MRQKKSSQLYSVSPKSFLRKPKKKRKSNTRTLLGITLGTLLFFVIVTAGYYVYSLISPVVSPLPIALGEKVVMTSSEKSVDEVKRLLSEHQIMYTAVALSGSDIVITMQDKKQVLLTKKKDIGEQISSLQVILPRLTMKGSEFRTLDLRFDKPIVTY